MQPVNPLRGEAEVVIAGTTYRLAATMADWARVSAALGDPPAVELYNRLLGGALDATRKTLAEFVQEGSVDGRTLKRREAAAAAVAGYGPADSIAVTAAFAALLNALMPDTPAVEDDEAKNPSAAPG